MTWVVTIKTESSQNRAFFGSKPDAVAFMIRIMAEHSPETKGELVMDLEEVSSDQVMDMIDSEYNLLGEEARIQ